MAPVARPPPQKSLPQHPPAYVGTRSCYSCVKARCLITYACQAIHRHVVEQPHRQGLRSNTERLKQLERHTPPKWATTSLLVGGGGGAHQGRSEPGACGSSGDVRCASRSHRRGGGDVCRCLLYLTDDDLVALLQRCAAALRPGGLIVIKENVCASGFVVDGDDNSLTRSHAYWMVRPRPSPPPPPPLPAPAVRAGDGPYCPVHCTGVSCMPDAGPFGGRRSVHTSQRSTAQRSTACISRLDAMLVASLSHSNPTSRRATARESW